MFGKKIKEYRLIANLTQEQLSEKVGLSPSSIVLIENGQTFVSADVIARFCEAFNIPPRRLFDIKPLKNNTHISDMINEIVSILEECNKKELNYFYDVIRSFKNNF